MADKQKIIAQLEIDVSNAEQSLQRLQGLGKEGLLGKKGAKESNVEIQNLVQKLAQLKTKIPGINAGEKEFKDFQKAVSKTTSEIQKCLGKMGDFNITDDYVKKNVEELKQMAQEAQKAEANLKKMKSAITKTNVNDDFTGYTKGTKGKSEEAERGMRRAAKEGSVDEVNRIAKQRKLELNQTMQQKPELKASLIKDMQHLTALQNEYAAGAEKVHAAMLNESTASAKLESALEGPKQAMIETQQTIQRESLEIKGSLQKAENGAYEMSQSFDQLRHSSNSIGEIGDQLMYLFSVTSIFYAIRRVVSDVIEDFKELDKQFNEIAIVSDKSTQEMWDQFSSVNEIAQKFGVTTSNVLEVQNLYYHQGKSSAEVTKLTAQTLTLAKITGMDYARATSDLTAALNAYNLKAEDAVRVTDTIAAMDTNAAISSEELMTALTKTASIAANAGMSLESTEIFLTKMIETTREAPENLGTALKTIIARFGEVKEEIDGEAVELADINRVDTALKTVGITLLDTTGQIRDLDDVFLELSSKWDDLDRNTQRYIATIAAGSRQQSRFIAMMEDYDRTLELTDAMNNSAGIGARQLAKSMESIETSLNTLKSSWQELTQKFLKNKMITGFLNSVNKILDVINELPPLIIAVGVAFLGWALKVKVLDKAMLTHKIIQDGLIKGEEAYTIAQRLKTAMTNKNQGVLKQYIKIMKDAATMERIQAMSTKDAAVALSAKAFAQKAATDAETEAALKAFVAENIQDEINEELWQGALAWATNEAVIDKVGDEYSQAAIALAAYNLLLDKNTKEINENTIAQSLNKGATNKNTGSKGANGLMSLFSGKGGKAGKGLPGALGKIGATLTKFIPYLVIIAVVLGAIYAVWKLFAEASKDDTKRIEALAKAQENYNNALQKYKGLRDKVNRLEKIQSSQYKTTDQREEEQSIIQELVEEYPTLLKYIDAEGNYHIKNIEAIKEEVLQQKELMKQSQATYNALQVSQARRGIYGDESSAMGKNISQLQDYYGSFDEAGLKTLAKSIDEFNLGFSQTEFKKLAEAYASGEKFSFNHKDFNNLFAGSFMTQEQFLEMSEEYEKHMEAGENSYNAMLAALQKIGLYDMETQEKIAKAWTNLNTQTGNIYSDLLTNIGSGLETLYVKEAEIFVDSQLGDTSGLNEEIKQGIAELYADFKEQEVQRLETEKRGEFEKEIPAYGFNSWANIFAEGWWILSGKEQSEIESQSEASTSAEEKYRKILEILSKPEIEILTNDIYENLMSQNVVSSLLQDPTNFKYYYDVLDSFAKNSAVPKGLESYFDSVYTSGLKDEEANAVISAMIDLYKMKLQEVSSFFNELSKKEAEFFKNKNFSLQDYSAIIDYYNNLGAEAGQAYASGLKEINDSGDTNLKQEYLALNFSNLSDVTQYLEKVKSKSNELGISFEALEKNAIDVAYASGAIHFGDVIAEAEELTTRFEDLISALEGFLGLASGEGDFTALSNYLNSFTDTIDDIGEFRNKMTEITNAGQLTLEGIKISGANNNAEDLVKQQQAQIMYEMRALEGQIQAATDPAEIKRLLTVQTLYRYAWGEAEAEYERKVREENIKALEEQVEQTKRARDALKDYVSWLREFDRYANLDRSITQIEREQGHLEFEVDFLTNTEGIKNSMQDTVENLNTQIAANQGGIAAAKEEQNMWKDVIQKHNSDYVSFGPNGEAIVNTAKLQELQEKLSTTTDESAREVLQAEYDEIMNNVSAYNKAQDKVEDYTNALEGNFKALEDFLNGTYENVKKVEDKLIEVRMAAEDKELEAVKDKYEAIKEENEKYLDSVRDMIDKERKIRDRANQEQDVKDKEKKLAMMKMDTSGIYAKDIQALERELNDDYQSLEDDAVDRAVEEMEDKYEHQAELYDKDIQFMENSLQYKREKMTEYNEWATQLIEQGSDAVLAYLKANDEEYYTGSAAAQALWESEWNGAVSRAVASNELLQSSLLNTVKAALENCKTEAGNFEDAVITYSSTAQAEHGKIQGSVQTLTSHFQNLAGGVDGVVGAIGRLEDAYRDAADEAQRLANLQGGEIVASPYTSSITNAIPPTITTGSSGGSEDEPTFHNAGTEARDYFDSMGMYGERKTISEIVKAPGTEEDEDKYYANVDGVGWIAVGDNDDYKDNILIQGTDEYPTNEQLREWAANKEKLQGRLFRIRDNAVVFARYATGGFADFTGPAWLDGTKKRPEAVLNALQTKHFIQFTNVLDTLFGGHASLMTPTQSAQKSGDANYTFHINVDQMASDYDVDRLIKRIEEKATKASQYRNVTVLKKSN